MSTQQSSLVLSNLLHVDYANRNFDAKPYSFMSNQNFDAKPYSLCQIRILMQSHTPLCQIRILMQSHTPYVKTESKCMG